MKIQKKILIVCNSEFVYDKFIKETYLELKKRYKVDILIGLEEGFKKNFFKKNFYYINIPKSLVKLLLRLPVICLEISNLFKVNKYDAIIHNNRNTSICSRLSIFFLKRKIKSIYFARGMYFHDNQNIFSFFFSYLLEIIFLLKTNLLLSQTKEDLKKIDFFLKILRIKYEYVGNGTSITKIKKKDFKGNYFVTICRITKNKGLEDLFFAYSQIKKIYPNSFLRIVGGPRTKDDFKYYLTLKKKFNLRNIKITGLVKNVKKYIFINQIYILPSYREGLSRSLLEAMSCGLIPIVSNIRGSREIIQNNYNGLIYKFGDKNDLFEKMKVIININYKKKKFMQKNAIKTIKEKFSQKLYLNKQIKKINYILN